MSLACERFDICRIHKPSGPHVPPDNFLEVLFEERNVALRHLHHARAIGMATGNWCTKIRQASRNHCSQVPRTVNSDLHASFLCSPETRAEPRAARVIRTSAASLIYSVEGGFAMHGREMYLRP